MFVGPPAVKMAGAKMRTIERDAPPALAAYLARTLDPILVKRDHQQAERVRRMLAFPTAR